MKTKRITPPMRKRPPCTTPLEPRPFCTRWATSLTAQPLRAVGERCSCRLFHRPQQPAHEPERDEREHDHEHPGAGRALSEVEELEALLVQVVRGRVGIRARTAAREREDDVEQLCGVDQPEGD